MIPKLKDIIDPKIFPHIKLLNKLGVETEYCCAGTGDARCQDFSISCPDKTLIVKKTHGGQSCLGNHMLPYIITSNKIYHRCKIVLGLISVLSPELFYCEKDKMLFGELINCQCACPKDIASISVRHKGFKLIDVYSTDYNRKYIGVDRNMAMLLQYNNEVEGEKMLPLIRKLFLKYLEEILKNIKKNYNF